MLRLETRLQLPGSVTNMVEKGQSSYKYIKYNLWKTVSLKFHETSDRHLSLEVYKRLTEMREASMFL